MKFLSKYKFFLHENATENIVCEMAAICPGRDELILDLDMPDIDIFILDIWI